MIASQRQVETFYSIEYNNLSLSLFIVIHHSPVVQIISILSQKEVKLHTGRVAMPLIINFAHTFCDMVLVTICLLCVLQTTHKEQDRENLCS